MSPDHQGRCRHLSRHGHTRDIGPKPGLFLQVVGHDSQVVQPLERKGVVQEPSLHRCGMAFFMGRLSTLDEQKVGPPCKVRWPKAGQEVRRFEGHESKVRGVALSPCGEYALSCGNDRTVRLWEVGTGREVERFLGHTDNVTSVAFSPDGRYALSGSSDRTVRLWKLRG